MNIEIDLSAQKLAAFVDGSVPAATVEWIESLARQTMIREAAVAAPPGEADLRNFGNRLLVGHLDVIIFVNAASVVRFVERTAESIERQRLLDSLADLQTISVGALTAERLREFGVEPSLELPDAKDWRELLLCLEAELSLANLRIGLEKTAQPHGLTAGLEARGASVVWLETMNFELPDPSSAEQDVLDSIEDGELGAILFANAICAARFMFLVSRREQPLLEQNARSLIVIVLDDETAELLSDCGFTTDIVLQVE